MSHIAPKIATRKSPAAPAAHRPGTTAQRQSQAATSNSPQMRQAATLQRVIDNSSRQQAKPAQHRHKTEFVASSIIQRKEPRSNNPHNQQTGKTSHHVIPHELLGKILDKFTGAGEKEEITRQFLPEFNSLALANFVAQVSVGVIYNRESPNKVQELPAEIAFKPLGKFSADEKAKTSFKVEGAGTISLTQFQELYRQLKSGGAITNEDGEEVSGLRDIGDSFFEWQSGNLFYGPERIEPGAKDGFDYDARLIYGEGFTNQIANIYSELRELQTKNDAASKISMKEQLAKMAALTVGKGVPMYDDDIWVPINSEPKKTVHDLLLPARHLTSKMGASVHHKVLLEAIKSYCTRDRAHNFLSFKNGKVQDISQEAVFAADKKAFWMKALPSKRENITELNLRDDFQTLMIKWLKELFGLA